MTTSGYILLCLFLFKSDLGLAIVKLNPLGANSIKWSNTLKQFVSKLPTNCLSVFDHFVKLMLKGLINREWFNKRN